MVWDMSRKQGKTAKASGDGAEAQVKAANDAYEARRMCYVRKRPTPYVITGGSTGGFTGRFTGTAGADYSGVLWGGQAVAMEVKSCARPSVPLKTRNVPTVKPAQIAEMTAVQALGGKALVLVRTQAMRQGRPVRTWWLFTLREWLAAVDAAEHAGASSISRALLEEHAAQVDAPGGVPMWMEAML